MIRFYAILLLFSAVQIALAEAPSNYELSSDDATLFAETLSKLTSPIKPSCDQYINYLSFKNNPVCTAHKNLWEAKIKDGFSLNSLSKKIQNDKVKVILLGEEHLSGGTQFYKDVLTEIKANNPSLDCLLLERPLEAGLEILAFVNGQYQSYQDIYLQPLIPAIEASNHLGIKILAGDPAQSITDDSWNLSEVGYAKRNLAISERIQHLLSSGKCKQIAMLIGKQHISNEDLHDSPSVPQLLGAKGVATDSINMVANGGNGMSAQRGDDTFVWHSCVVNPRNPVMTLAFDKTKISQSTLMDEYGGRLADFDYDLILPDTDFRPFNLFAPRLEK